MKKIDKKTQIKIIKIMLIIIWMIVVFLFSNQQGTESSNTSRKVTEIVTYIASKGNVEVNANHIESLETIIRKLAHFTIYTIGGFLIMNYANTTSKNDKEKILYSIAFGVGYAITDELHQFFTPGRSARAFDVGIDSFGVITGVLIFLIIRKIIAARKTQD